MKGESLCLRVLKPSAEKVRQQLIQLALMDVERRISGGDRFVDIPLLREPDDNEWKVLRGLAPETESVEVESRLLEKAGHPRSVAEVLKDRIDPKLLPSVGRSFDVIGDIAIIEVARGLDSVKRLIAEAIIEVHRGVKTVLCKSGAVDGQYRVRSYEHVLGEARTVTTHREHGCQYVLDVTKVYFSPRLATEHLRVASQVSPKEIVIDMFAGVGPFAILIAKKKGAVVHAIDVNPDAVRYIKMNCRLNKVERLVDPILGDARVVISRNLAGIADRIIMNLPSASLEFMDAACSALKPGGGVLHSYQFQSGSDPIGDAVEALRVRLKSLGRTLHTTLGGRLVRSSAPHEWQVAVDSIVE
ncbi:MAG: class I SAM-dependent methyltransferase family protein [Promethearchaeati archaeon SRVP18_Atabeyarchaeia-1]